MKSGLTGLVPLDVIAELMALRGATAFADWYHAIVAASVSNVTGDPAIHEQGVAARDDLFAWLTPVIGEKRARPTNDLLSDLSNIEYEGEQLSDDEVRSFCAFLLSAGIETTDRALVNLCRELTNRPDQWARLKHDRSLIPSAVAEILRLRSPVQASVRQTIDDVELGPAHVPAGSKLALLLGSANHNENVFSEPGRFDLDRFAENAAAQFTPVGPQRGFGGGALEPSSCMDDLSLTVPNMHTDMISAVVGPGVSGNCSVGSPVAIYLRGRKSGETNEHDCGRPRWE